MKKRVFATLLCLCMMLTLLPSSALAEDGFSNTVCSPPLTVSNADIVANPNADVMNATVYYVATTGSDIGGNGSQGAPWATPNYAATQVASGSTIYITAGTYNLSSPIELPVGVDLTGDGASTILTSSTLQGEQAGNNALLRLISPLGGNGEKTDGNQNVYNLSFNGNATAAQAIEIQNRNNVTIHDCSIVNFAYVGVGWRATDVGGSSDTSTPPTYCVTGGKFYNNYMKDNSFYGTDPWYSPPFARGALWCGGLKGFEIYGNTIIEDCRTGVDGIRGVPIKFWYYTGWMLGCKIHDNVIQRLGSTVVSADWNGGWAFAIESEYHSGLEIYNNSFVGAIDLNEGLFGVYNGTNYEYATYIHGNTFTPDPVVKTAWGNADYEQFAIVLERRSERTIIESNTITGYDEAVYFNAQRYVRDFTFRNNLCTDIGEAQGSMFRMDGGGSEIVVENFTITGNIFEGSRSSYSGFGIIVSQEMVTWSGRNISITDNAIGYARWNWLVIDDYSTIDGLTITGNKRFETGGEYRIRDATAVSGYTYSGNDRVTAEEWQRIRDASVYI